MQWKASWGYRLMVVVWIMTGVCVYGGDLKVTDTKDTVTVENGKVSLRVEKGQKGKVCFAWADNAKPAVKVDIVPGSSGGKAFTVIKNYAVDKNKDSLAVKVSYELSGGKTAKIVYILKDALEYVGISEVPPQVEISLKMRSKALVVPDHIGESIVCYPSAKAVEYSIPSDAVYTVNMLEEGNAAMAVIWPPNKAVVSEKSRGNSCFDSLTVTPEDGRLWAGIIGRGTWRKVSEKLNNMKFTAIDWNPPFPAHWVFALKKDKGVITQADGQYDIWYIPERKDDKKKPAIQRGITMTNVENWKGWASGIGAFIYPGYFREGRTFLLLPKYDYNKDASYDDSFPALIYPLFNDKKTKGVTLPFNAVRKFLGAEVYYKLMSVSSPENKYPPTCGITHKIEKIFYHDKAKEDLGKIKDMLAKMDKFVITIRKRIGEYLAWRKLMRQSFATQRKQTPDIKSLIDEFDRELNTLDKLYAAAEKKMKTPKYCQSLSQKIIKLATSNMSAEKQEDECKEIGRAIRTIGGAQDKTLGRMRMLTKAVRQKATAKLLTCRNPDAIKFLQTVRSETAAIMDKRVNMEGK